MEIATGFFLESILWFSHFISCHIREQLLKYGLRGITIRCEPHYLYIVNTFIDLDFYSLKISKIRILLLYLQLTKN